MDLSIFIDFINKYGTSAVVVGVALWGIYKLIDALLQMVNKTDDRIERAEIKKDEANEQIISILKELMSSNQREAEEKHKRACAKRKHIARICTEYVKQLKEETGADRVVIHDYCNGSNSLTGIPFLHFRVMSSREDKSVRRNVIGNKFAIECLGNFLIDLEEEGIIIIKHTNKEVEEKYPELYKELKFSKQSKGVFSDIKNDGMSVGFLSVTFSSEKKVDYENVQKIIKKHVALLSDLLGNPETF